MSIKIDIDVINNILTSYNRANTNQTRVYGIVLGTQKDDTYHITNAIYGYIFEEGKENNKINFNRLNNDSVNALLSSHSQSYPDEVILGGFATDKDLFPELNNLHGTIDLIKPKLFPINNQLLILVDPFYKGEKVGYGVRGFKWEVSYQVGNNQEDLSVMAFKEIECVTCQKLTPETLINTKGVDQWRVDCAIDKIDIKEKGTIDKIVDSLCKMEGEFENKIIDDVSSNESENINYIKGQLILCGRYLSLMSKYLDGVDIEDKDNVEILNKIELAVSLMKPFIEKEEIVELMKKDNDRNKIVSALVGLLNVQVQLTEKINKLSL